MKPKEVAVIAGIALAVIYALRSIETKQLVLPLLGPVGPRLGA